MVDALGGAGVVVWALTSRSVAVVRWSQPAARRSPVAPGMGVRFEELSQVEEALARLREGRSGDALGLECLGIALVTECAAGI